MSKVPAGSRQRFLFVSGFKNRVADGSLGGQVRQARMLLESEISDYIEFVKIDSTQKSFSPTMLERGWEALRRLVKVSYYLLFGHLDGSLVMCAGVPSFLEKGVILLLTKLAGKRAVLAPRSGTIVKEVHSSQLVKLMVAGVVRVSDATLCQSQTWKNFYASISGCKDNKFFVIPNWIDLRPYKRVRAEARRASKTIVFMGLVVASKGVFDLVEAAYNSRAALKGWQIEVCGVGEVQPLRDRIRDRGLTDVFTIRGWLDDLERMEALLNASIFVLPSHMEGLPNSLLEAMASGLPFVATHVGGIPEVTPKEYSRFLLEPGDIEGLSRALEELVSDPELRAKFGEQALNSVGRYCSIETQWRQVYHCMTGQTAPAKE